MAIVTLFSVVMHFSINDKLVAASNHCLSYCCLWKPSMSTSQDSGIAEIVKEIVARVSNTCPTQLKGETDLTEIGISSMALPVAISEINIALKSLKGSKKLSSMSFQGPMTVNSLIALASEGHEQQQQQLQEETRQSDDTSSNSLDLDDEIDLEQGIHMISG
eukprot:CAMPEP_0116156136 /NCGR_PEP_ID=MMETSP0329-20121206/22672_1 /TAXON_ID=697910 /ORGANISM="Pseudo-nitzschia arenysensis, Strain B593" /LENGTH=161 /DNA_ID=CAMNT_0003653201 /DNA_START=300 /DNA_END=785 /DNA_ORIENTATION=+